MARARFPSLTARTPLDVAGRIVLAARLRTARQYLARIASRPGEEPEDTHQLRVATRRLAASLAIFRQCLDPRDRRPLKRVAKRLRRAAGLVRDLDVQRAMLQKRLRAARGLPSAIAKRLLRRLERERSLAQQELDRALSKWTDRFERTSVAVLESLKREQACPSQASRSLGAVAGSVLTRRLDQLLTAGRRSLADLDNLHRLRIAAKRLRYAMEVFVGCYPPAFRRDLYEEAKSLQSELGDINDLRNLHRMLQELEFGVGSERLHDHRPDAGSQLSWFGATIDRELLEQQREFASHWARLGRSGFARRFRRLLAGRRPRRSLGTAKK